LAHFDGEGHRVEQLQGLLVRAALLVGVALTPRRQKVHGGHSDDARRPGRQIEFLVLFFVVKGHGYFLPFFGWAWSARQVRRVRAVMVSRSSTSSTQI